MSTAHHTVKKNKCHGIRYNVMCAQLNLIENTCVYVFRAKDFTLGTWDKADPNWLKRMREIP